MGVRKATVSYVKDLVNLRCSRDTLEMMLLRQLALWVWNSEESSGPGRTHVRIIRAVHNLPQGVGMAVPVS